MNRSTKKLLTYAGIAAGAVTLFTALSKNSGVAGVGDAASDWWYMRQQQNAHPAMPWWRQHHGSNDFNNQWWRRRWTPPYYTQGGQQQESTFSPFSGYAGGYGGYYGYGQPSAVEFEQPGSVASQSAMMDAQYGGSL